MSAGTRQRNPATGARKRNPATGARRRNTDTITTCCCDNLTYRQFKKCSDDTLADLWEPDAIRTYPATVLNLSDGLCYYIDSDHPTSATPGTVAGGTATVTDCDDPACTPCSVCGSDHPSLAITISANVATTDFDCGNVAQWAMHFPASWSGTFTLNYIGETAPGICVWALDTDCSTFPATITIGGITCDFDLLQITVARLDLGGGNYAWEVGASITLTGPAALACFGESVASDDGCWGWELFSASASDEDSTCDEDVIIAGDPIDNGDNQGPSGGGSVTLQLA